MSKVEIVLIAKGPKASGKTRVLELLTKYLKTIGLEVTGHHVPGNKNVKNYERHAITVKGELL